MINTSIPDDLARQMYEELIFIRKADDKIIKLQRQGRMGTYASVLGQEGYQVGFAHALEKTDWVVPAFREFGIALLHGVPLEKIYLYWAGNEIGSNYDANVLPISIPVGTQPLHAVGISWASKIRKEKNIAVAFFGDGATSEGDFHEAMNFAGVFNTPTVFVCQNNGWAISTPFKKQTKTKTIAEKAAAYGFEGVLVDGNDVFASYSAMKKAAEKARSGGGPTLIEAVTYRMGDHTTSDDASKYRDEKECEEWKSRCPVLRLKNYLISKKLWDEKFENEILARSDEKIKKAVEAMEKTPVPTKEDISKHLFA